MSDRDYLYGHVCVHGSLARSCEVCELEAEVRQLRDLAGNKAHVTGHGLELLAGKDGGLWRVSSSSDPAALAVVDGTGRFEGHGPHYSRRTPGSRTFTGVGQEIVLVSVDGAAVWAVVRQRTPSRRGTGASRGRDGAPDDATRYIWRNMMFRNLGPALSSDLVREATELTYRLWPSKYGGMPAERLRTEVDVRRVRSSNPGYCYKMAGYVADRTVRGKLYLWAPAAADAAGAEVHL